MQLRLLVVEGAEGGVFEEGVAEFVESCEKVELGGGVEIEEGVETAAAAAQQQAPGHTSPTRENQAWWRLRLHRKRRRPPQNCAPKRRLIWRRWRQHAQGGECWGFVGLMVGVCGFNDKCGAI